MDSITISISKHASQRYCERIMQKSTPSEIAEFVTNQSDKIKQDILAMIQYGKLVYSGKSINICANSIVDVYLNGTWVILVGHDTHKVITLYSIDLGLGQEFNKDYVDRLSSKLEDAKVYKSNIETELTIQKDMYTGLIRENDTTIAMYRKTIKELENQNSNYKELINSLNTNLEVAETKIREVVGIMIGKKVI